LARTLEKLSGHEDDFDVTNNTLPSSSVEKATIIDELVDKMDAIDIDAANYEASN
jgi:hypothetical protein